MAVGGVGGRRRRTGWRFCVFYTFQTIWSQFAILFHWIFLLLELKNILRYMKSSRKFWWNLFLPIDSKWSETRKKHKTADPSVAADRWQPVFRVEYVNTSYHTTFHQNISINVACIHKRPLVPWKCQNAPPP